MFLKLQYQMLGCLLPPRSFQRYWKCPVKVEPRFKKTENKEVTKSEEPQICPIHCKETIRVCEAETFLADSKWYHLLFSCIKKSEPVSRHSKYIFLIWVKGILYELNTFRERPNYWLHKFQKLQASTLSSISTISVPGYSVDGLNRTCCFAHCLYLSDEDKFQQ